MEVYIGLAHNILNKCAKEAINNIENIYSQGKDLKLYIKQFIQFILDICKYDLYKDYKYIQIPNTIKLEEFKNIYYEDKLNLLDEVIDLSNQIKYEQNPKILIESKILLLCRKGDSNESSKI